MKLLGLISKVLLICILVGSFAKIRAESEMETHGRSKENLHYKAPRPNAQELNSAVVGAQIGNCAAILPLLQEIKGCCSSDSLICAELLAEFQGTFTVLNDITNSFSLFDSQLDILVLTTSILINSSTDLISSISALTEVTNNFTIQLESIEVTTLATLTTLIECCSISNENFSGTFTSFQATWTILESIVQMGCSAIPITQNQINQAGGTIQLTAPGNYFFTEDIISLGSGTDPIIQIDSSNITLDLCGRSLSGIDGNKASGIFINTTTHVTIKNGIIQDMLISGVMVNGGCTDIVLESITTLSCGLYGIQIGDSVIGNPSPNLATITDLRISECAALACGQLFLPTPVAFRGSSRFVLNYFGGLYAFNCTNLVIENSSFNENLSGNVFGFFIANCNNCTLTNCLANNNRGVQFIQGGLITDSNNILLSKCQFNNNTGDPTSLSVTAGISFAGVSNIEFNDCQASNNSAESGTGFFGSNCQNALFINCAALNNSGSSNDSVGFSLIKSTGCQVTGCKAINNSSSSGEAIGFLFTRGFYSTFENCQSIGHIGNSLGAGFVFRAQTSSLITDCTANINEGVIVGYGILLDQDGGSVFSTNCVIKNNITSNNTGGTSFGIRDTAANSLNVIAGNLSFNNTKNYDVTYSSAALPVVAGSFSSTLPATGSTGTYDNVSIDI